MIQANDLHSFGITLNDYLNYGNLAGNRFYVPQKIIKLNPEYENNSELLFNSIAIGIFHTINNILGQLPERYKAENFETFKANVSPKNAENLRCMVFEELKFRIFNNVWPEFANKQFLNFGGYSALGDSYKFNDIKKLLSPDTLGYLYNSDWSKLAEPDEIAEILKAYPTFEDLKKFKNELSKEIDIAKNDEVIEKIEAVKNSVNENYTSYLIDKRELNTSVINNKQLINDTLSSINSNKLELTGKINELDNKITNARLKTEMLETALTANTVADAETLRKFNQLQTEHNNITQRNTQALNDINRELLSVKSTIPNISGDTTNKVNWLFSSAKSEGVVIDDIDGNEGLKVMYNDGEAEISIHPFGLIINNEDEETQTVITATGIELQNKESPAKNFIYKTEIDKLIEENKKLNSKIEELTSKLNRLDYEVGNLKASGGNRRPPNSGIIR